jgi:hypothetical protein
VEHFASVKEDLEERVIKPKLRASDAFVLFSKRNSADSSFSRSSSTKSLECSEEEEDSRVTEIAKLKDTIVKLEEEKKSADRNIMELKVSTFQQVS